jgi:hypothetical protein
MGHRSAGPASAEKCAVPISYEPKPVQLHVLTQLMTEKVGN